MHGSHTWNPRDGTTLGREEEECDFSRIGFDNSLLDPTARDFAESSCRAILVVAARLHELDDSISVESLTTCPNDVRNREEAERTGRATRAALVFMRFMFMSGRKSVIRPVESL